MALPVAIKNKLDELWDRLQNNTTTNFEYDRITIGKRTYKIVFLQRPHRQLDGATKYQILILERD